MSHGPGNGCRLPPGAAKTLLHLGETVTIAAGERLVTKFEFSKLLQKQAAQIIQADVGQCGGILEAKKIAAISEAHYAMIAPHMFCGPVAFAAAAARYVLAQLPHPGIQRHRFAQ